MNKLIDLMPNIKKDTKKFLKDLMGGKYGTKKNGNTKTN